MQGLNHSKSAISTVMVIDRAGQLLPGRAWIVMVCHAGERLPFNLLLTPGG
jgi:hypothetical protein